METIEKKTVKRPTEKNGQVRKLSQEEFIVRAMNVHKNEKGGSKYLYDKVEYKTSKEKVIVTCILHGDFEITPNDLLDNHGCATCGKIKYTTQLRSTKDEFLKKAIKKHHDENDEPLFLYDEVEYVNSVTPIVIKCKNGHRFEQTPENHLRAGCSECSGKFKYNTSTFIKKAESIHKGEDDKPLFDYSLVEYKTSRTNITISCKKGHQFEIKPHLHLEGKGCQECDKQKKKEMKK